MTSQTEVAKRVPKTLAGADWNGPATYHLFVEFVSSAPVKGQQDVYVGRVGTTNDLDKVPAMIADDLKAMGDTYGGLVEATSTKGRLYRLFKMTPEELRLSDILAMRGAKNLVGRAKV